jgi:hypothetical protein
MITLATNFSGNHKRVKHFLTNINFLIFQVKKNTIKLVHESSQQLRSDQLTKALGPTQNKVLSNKLLTGGK